MTKNDLPIEVIEAVRILEEYLNSMKMASIKVDWLGGICLVGEDGKTEKYISPIALDLKRVIR